MDTQTRNFLSNSCMQLSKTINTLGFHPWMRQRSVVKDLLTSRNLHDIQNVQYELLTAYSLDLDPTKNFLLVGLSNGSLNIQEIIDSNLGKLERVSHLNITNTNIHRVQWFPGDEEFLTALDNHTLFVVDPNKLQIIERYNFHIDTLWSDWNPNTSSVIAICGSDSQVRFVDIRDGSSIHSITLTAPSKLPTHKATRCLWSKCDTTCLVIGDNEGYLHIYDTRHTTRPLNMSQDEFSSQISGIAFTNDMKYIITSHGFDNRLVEWSFDKCQIVPNEDKFKKTVQPNLNQDFTSSSSSDPLKQGTSSYLQKVNNNNKKKRVLTARVRLLPCYSSSTYLRCQFHVTDNLIFSPAPSNAKNSKELDIYDIHSGIKIKTVQSDTILSSGVYCVTSLLPRSLTLFVGGRGRLRVWSLDEDYERKRQENVTKFHVDQWDSD